MTSLYLVPRVLGLIAATALAAAATNASGQCAGCGGGCWAILAPTRLSPLDLRLRPYYIPRTPDWGPHEYRYDVKEPTPYCGCGPACTSGDGPCLFGGCSYPPEAAAGFDPCEFETLGQIPNDSLLEGAAAVRSQ
jgi:hypothetical protein